MNRVHPKALLYSKWTKVEVHRKERHFAVIKVRFDEEQRVIECIIEAVMTKNQYSIPWRELKNPQQWLSGWR